MANRANLNVEHSLLQAVAEFLGDTINPLKWLDGGDEAIILQATSHTGLVVVHASPSWRTRSELDWVHAVARHTRAQVSEAIVPIERDGRSTFEWNERQVAVYPYVAGTFLNRDDAALRAHASRLLSAIHRSLLDFPGGIRPSNDTWKPSVAENPVDIGDSELDAWWSSVGTQDFTIGPTHGDYYRRNLLCSGRRIVGIIDWHDASVRSLALELAQVTFEICRDENHTFQFDRGSEFVQQYLAAGGPIPAREVESLIPLIRVWIREDIRWSLASGTNMSDEYVIKQIRAFRNLATCEWVPV